MTAHRIEARIRGAVGIVLASAGCQSSTPVVVVVPRDPNTAASTTPAATESPAPSASDAVAPDESPRPRVSPENTAAFCADYKSHSKVDARTAAPSRSHNDEGDDDFRVNEGGRWLPNHNVACTLVRQRTATPHEVMYTPTCCPSGRGNQPCPPAQKMTVNTVNMLVEVAELRPDGGLVTSKVFWATNTPGMPRHHNCGRRPEGFIAAPENDKRGIGAELAAMAELEAASVPAFERLARELRAHDAPADLVRRARAAMADEVRHARTMRDLSTSFGGAPQPVDVPMLPCRDLAEVARENAAEGCVREAFGALVATFQAERAAPTLRPAFREIAADERRHAALAEDVHAWITTKLSPAQREDVDAHRARALAELEASLRYAGPVDGLGLPTRSQAAGLYAAYFT